MATDQALRGLDSLELEPATPRADSGRIARKAWAALWPKLLAIALVLAIWELVTLSGWKKLVFKGPGPVFSDLWHQAVHGNLWSVIGATLQSAVVGYALALVIGTVIGVLVARIPPLRAAVGSIITGLQTMPSIAWVPFAIIIFGENSSAILFVVILGAAPSIANGLITGVDYAPPLLLRPAVSSIRAALLRRFRALAGDDPGPELARVARARMTDRNIRPAEVRRLQTIADAADRRAWPPFRRALRRGRGYGSNR